MPIPDGLKQMLEGLGAPGITVEVVDMTDPTSGNPLGEMFAAVYSDFLFEFCTKACDSLRADLEMVVGTDELEAALANAGLRAPVKDEPNESNLTDPASDQGEDSRYDEELTSLLLDARAALIQHKAAGKAAVAAVQLVRDMAKAKGLVDPDRVSDI